MHQWWQKREFFFFFFYLKHKFFVHYPPARGAQIDQKIAGRFFDILLEECINMLSATV